MCSVANKRWLENVNSRQLCYAQMSQPMGMPPGAMPLPQLRHPLAMPPQMCSMPGIEGTDAENTTPNLNSDIPGEACFLIVGPSMVSILCPCLAVSQLDCRYSLVHMQLKLSLSVMKMVAVMDQECRRVLKDSSSI